MLLLERKQVSALEFNHHESPFFFFAAHHSVTSFNLQISDDISDQTKEIQKLKCEIRSCDTKLDHASHRLDILNQRPGYELCRDLVSAISNMTVVSLHCPLKHFNFNPLLLLLQPHISLTLENYDLVKIGAGLRSALKLSQ